ncbi:MAG: agmatinase [Deltaproteobacteria bacterium]|nr:agmatinase [Deltaproteobacteria bacterium]
MNYGGPDLPNATLEKARFVVVPIPYDLTTSYQSGTRRGPSAIIDASSYMELYDEELQQETYLCGIHTEEPVEADSRGPEKMTKRIRGRIARILARNKIPVVLGGEHSVTIGVVQAMKEKYPDISVLQFDAHADLRDAYQGSPYSHACAARRIWELCPLTQMGIRSMSAEDAAFIKKNKINSFPADFVHEADWLKKVTKYLTKDVYVTIDLDALDPSIMPATGTPEPGGMSWRNLLSVVREVAKKHRIRGFDVVELSPIPGLVAPDFLASKLVYRIMGYMTAPK